MKLNLRARALGKKVTLITTAFVLAVSTLTASVPFVLSERVGAVAGYTYSPVSKSQADWTVDRQAPSGFWSVDSATGRVLISVDQTKSATSSHHKTEGVTTSVASGSTSVSASVYVNQDWSQKSNLRVGLWGVTDSPVSWPIIEYANVAGFNGWRVWNTTAGEWVPLVGAAKTAGNYKLEIIISAATNSFIFSINDTEVLSLPADGQSSFEGIILNSYNAGTNNRADNYVADWRSIQSGRATAPVIDQAPVYVGGSEVYDLATWTHNGVNVSGFEYREYNTLELANADTTGTTGAYWTVPHAAADRSQVVGHSWKGEKVLYYRVVTIDSYGNRSLPSPVGTVVVDKNAPTVTLPADSGTVRNSLSLSGTVTDSHGIKEYKYQILDENKNNLTGALAQYGYSRDGGTAAVEGGLLATVDTSVLPTGNYTLRVWAFDMAGNRTGTKNAPHITKFAVDRTSPQGALTYSNNGNPTWQNVTVTLTTTEPVSLVGASGWSMVSSTQYTKTFSVNTTTPVTFVDAHGNDATLQVQVSGINKNVQAGLYPISLTTTTPLISGVVVYEADQAQPVEGLPLDVYVNGVRYDVTTDEDGEWRITSAVLANGSVNTVRVFFDGGDTTSTALVSRNVPTQVPVVTFPVAAPVDSSDTPDTNQSTNGGLPFTTFGVAQQVLGADTTIPQSAAENNGTPAVAGSATQNLAQAVDADNTDGTAMGLAWYWWLLIIAAVATIIWGIVAAIRGRQSA